MEIICAFSSDSRELYKADIYRVLALPEGHILHFRYKKKWVDDNLLPRNAMCAGTEVAIFYTFGNSSDSQSAQTSVSVRKAEICLTEISDETEVFHVYMILKKFCNITIDSGNSEEKRPPTKYFSRLKCTELATANNWQSRISAIKGNFTEITFFNVKGIVGECGDVPLSYRGDNKTCSYELIHGQRYTLKLALANPNPKTCKTKIELGDASDAITFNCVNPIETSIEFDDYDIPFSINSLQVHKQASLFKFSPKSMETDFGEYATNLELNLSLSKGRAVVFGLCSTVAVAALFIAQPISNSSEWPSTGYLVSSFAMFLIASSTLFYWFNKR